MGQQKISGEKTGLDRGGAVSDEQLERVSGGNQIDPRGGQPKSHAPVSIAQGDTLDNTLLDDNLPNA
jgi:hypothetical protein